MAGQFRPAGLRAQQEGCNVHVQVRFDVSLGLGGSPAVEVVPVTPAPRLVRAARSPGRVIDTGIRRDYAGRWAIPEALREWYANARDTGTRVRTVWRDGRAVIEDQGPGLPVSALALGGSTKAGDSGTVGQFGEGAKLAIKTAAALGREHRVETVGFTVRGEFRQSEQYGVETLHLLLTPNDRARGTRVVCGCSREEFEAGLGYFLDRARLHALDEALGIYIPGGEIYIAGVRVQKVRAIASYDVPDKRQTNRDRDLTDILAVQEHIARVWSRTAKERAIECLLRGLESDPGALEGQSEILPVEPERWRRVAERVWQAPAVSSTPECDAAAKAAGYTVIRNNPPLMRLLAAIGVPRTDELVRPDQWLQDRRGRRYVLTISPHWARDMQVAEALRELAANAMDARATTPGDRCRIRYDASRGEAVFENSRACLCKEHLVLGIGRSDGRSTIGQFHTGLKQVLALMAREGRAMELELPGETLAVGREKDPEFGVELVVLAGRPNRRRQGTRVRVECLPSEFEELEAYFRKPRRLDKGIYDCPGKIYVRGVFVQQVRSLMSYDLEDNSILSMDRRHVNIYRAGAEIARILSRSTSPEVARRYLTGWEGELRPEGLEEYRFELELAPAAFVVWKRVARRKFRRACLPMRGAPHFDSLAGYNGWRVLSGVPDTVWALLYRLGIPTSEQAVTKLARPRKSLGVRVRLSPEERRRLRVVRRFFRLFFPEDAHKPVKVVAILQEEGRQTLGLYRREEDAIYLDRSLLHEDTPAALIRLLGTAAHEQAHRLSGATDLSWSFQDALTQMAGYLAGVALRVVKPGKVGHLLPWR